MGQLSGKTLSVRLTVVLLLAVLIGSVALCYGVTLWTVTAKLAALEQATVELQRRNSQLEEQVSSLNRPTSNASVLGFNYVEVYQSASRSIVTIEGSKIETVMTFFGPRQSIYPVSGSGFVIDHANLHYVITNFHVIDGIVNATVTFADGNEYPITVIGSDALSDLAVVSIDNSPSDLHSLDFSSSSSLEVGEPVVAIGSPFGLSGSMTFGIISQLGRSIQYESTSGIYSIADIIQFSAPINPGNSGGPLLDTDGSVVGITSAAVSDSEGLGFAIPSDTILRELPDLIATGKYDKHTYFGIHVVNMNYELSQAAGTNITYGLLIERTEPDGPADKAGLEGGSRSVNISGQEYTVGGDIIVSMDGIRIVNFDDFLTHLERHTLPGQVIQVGIIRSGQHQIVQVTVEAKPAG